MKMKYINLNHDNEKTIWQNFESDIQDENSIEQIIRSLSFVNAIFIAFSSDDLAIEDKMLEIVEFGDKFYKKYGKKTKKARYENWGREAYSLRLYKNIKENCKYEISVLRKLEAINKSQLNKLVNLEKDLCNIKGDKNLTICLEDGHCLLTIEGNKQNLKKDKVARAILNDALSSQAGVIINRKNFDGTSNVYAFRTNKYEIETISIEELKMSYSIDARTGKKIKIPSDLVFKEFKHSQREI